MSCSSTISCLGCLSLPLKEEKEAHIHTVWTFIPNSSSPHLLHWQVQPTTTTCFQAQWSLLLSWLYLKHFFFFFGPEKSDSLQALKQQKRVRGSPWKMNFQLLKPGLVILAGEALAFKCKVYTHSHHIYSVNRWLTLLSLVPWLYYQFSLVLSTVVKHSHHRCCFQKFSQFSFRLRKIM